MFTNDPTTPTSPAGATCLLSSLFNIPLPASDDFNFDPTPSEDEPHCMVEVPNLPSAHHSLFAVAGPALPDDEANMIYDDWDRAMGGLMEGLPEDEMGLGLFEESVGEEMGLQFEGIGEGADGAEGVGVVESHEDPSSNSVLPPSDDLHMGGGCFISPDPALYYPWTGKLVCALFI